MVNRKDYRYLICLQEHRLQYPFLQDKGPWSRGHVYEINDPHAFAQIKNELFQSLWDQQVSIFLLPAQHQDTDGKWIYQPDAVFFDMDSTLIEQEALDFLARELGLGMEIERLTHDAMEGVIDFDTSLRARVQLLAGTSLHTVQSIAKKLSLQPGLQQVVKILHAQNIPLFIVSGSFVEFVKPFADLLGVCDFLANQFEWHDHSLSGHIHGAIVNATAKAEWVDRMKGFYDLDGKMVMVIGDGANDLAMIQNAEIAIGYHPKKVLLPFLDGFIAHSDDYQILQLLLSRS